MRLRLERLWRSTLPWWPRPCRGRRRSGSAGRPSFRTWSPPRAACRSGARADREVAARRGSRRPTADRCANSETGVTDSQGWCDAICHSVLQVVQFAGIPGAEEQVHSRVLAPLGEVHDERAQRRKPGAARDHQHVAALAGRSACRRADSTAATGHRARFPPTMVGLTMPPVTERTWNSMAPLGSGGIAGLRYRHRRGHCGTCTVTYWPAK